MYGYLEGQYSVQAGQGRLRQLLPQSLAAKNKFFFTVNSRYLEVVGTIFYKFKLPEVQINLHFG